MLTGKQTKVANSQTFQAHSQTSERKAPYALKIFSRFSVKFADFKMPNNFTTKTGQLQSVSDDGIALFQANLTIYLVVYYMTGTETDTARRFSASCDQRSVWTIMLSSPQL
jgi:hypothetical protein